MSAHEAEHEAMPEGDEAPPPGVRAMAVVRWLLVLGMAVVAGLSLAHHYGLWKNEQAESAQRYQCPMHPSVVQDHPGDCPICGMALVAVKSGGVEHEHAHAVNEYYCPMHPEVVSTDPEATCPKCGGMKLVPKPVHKEAPRLVELGSERAQEMGVKTAKVARSTPPSDLTTWGVIRPKDGRVGRVHARSAGYVEELFVRERGTVVAKGQPLLSLYSPELVAAQRELLTAERWAAAHADTHGAPEAELALAAREKLRTLGVSDADIDAVVKAGEPHHALVIRAPQGGFVSDKPVVRGSYVDAGALLVELIDLSEVWVLAEAPESALPRLTKGMAAEVRVPGEAAPRTGRVELVTPELDVNQRTAELRVGLDNRDLALRAGTSAEVRISLAAREGLYIPASAVLDTGDRTFVYSSHEDGKFARAPVALGARAGELVEVLSGLQEGDLVVTSAAFLLDAETRLGATAHPEHER